MAVVSDALRRLPPTSVGEADPGVWLFLDTWDSVCLRTASVEWNVPGMYGPHGELFFFLIQEESATMPGSETPEPVPSLLTSARPAFSADVLKKCVCRHAPDSGRWKRVERVAVNLRI